MTSKLNNDIIPEFLISSRFKVLRHLLLIFIMLVITLHFVWYLPDFLVSIDRRMLGWALYFSLFLSGIYINVYFIAPQFLFKNKLRSYFISLVLITLILILGVFIIQRYLFQVQELLQTVSISYTICVINIISATLTVFLILASTTTVLIFRYWINYNKQIDELESATLQSELKMLKNQINPHFLFNMLNNANVLIKKRKAEAPEVLFKLEDLLRYQINDSSKDKVSLRSDIHFLNDFLNLEKIRRDKFDFAISKDGDIDNVFLPPLLFIPFVENAVKHNPDSENFSYVNISFKVRENKLEFQCENSKPEVLLRSNKIGGLGLRNITRRLELLYPQNYTLEVRDRKTNYRVNLNINL